MRNPLATGGLGGAHKSLKATLMVKAIRVAAVIVVTIKAPLAYARRNRHAAEHAERSQLSGKPAPIPEHNPVRTSDAPYSRGKGAVRHDNAARAFVQRKRSHHGLHSPLAGPLQTAGLVLDLNSEHLFIFGGDDVSTVVLFATDVAAGVTMRLEQRLDQRFEFAPRERISLDERVR